MQTLSFILNWFIYSSKDQEKISLTVKGLAGVLGVVLAWFGFSGIDFGPLVNDIVQFIVAVGGAISAFATLWGSIRKIDVTLKGEHPLLQ